MGGDNQRAVIAHILSHHLAELTLRGDIQSVGRLVHQQHLRTCSQSKGHESLLLLTHRESIQLQIHRQLKIFQATLQHCHTELRIERTVDLHVLLQRHCWQIELLRYDEDLLQCIRQSLTCLDAIETNVSLLRTKQSADQIQQRTLTRAVLAQQTVNVILFQFQTEIFEYQVLLTCVLKIDVFYFNHSCIYLLNYPLL